MALVRPHEGDASGTAALLLALADREDNDYTAYDIKTNTDDGLQFDVPDDLADAYLAELGAGPAPKVAEEVAAAEEEVDEDPAPVAPVKRGPGRPRKNPEA